MKDLHRLIAAGAFGLLLTSVSAATVSPTDTAVQTPTPTWTPTAIASPDTPTAVPTPTDTPAGTISPAPTPTATWTPDPQTPTPTGSPTPEPTWSLPSLNDPGGGAGGTPDPFGQQPGEGGPGGAPPGLPGGPGSTGLAGSPGSGTPTTVPLRAETPAEGLFAINLPMESSLQIRGRKSIEAKLQARKYRPGSQQAKYGNQPLDIKQELQVLLDGKVGRKITVNVNYDDTRFESQKQVISVRYQGDPDEIFEEAQFGDIQLNLGNTQFASYNKQLFGLSAKTSFFGKRLSLMAVGAQTKGIVQTIKFVGPYAEVTKTIPDTAFNRYRYYWVHQQLPASREATPPPLQLMPGTEEVWVDDGNPSYHSGYQVSQKFAIQDYRTRVWFTGSRFLRYLRPGIDYEMDYESGILIVRQGNLQNAFVAVAYTQRSDGRRVGYLEDAVVPNTYGGDQINESLLNVIQYPSLAPPVTPGPGQTPPPVQIDDSHHITHIYELGDRKLDRDLFELTVLDRNSVPQTSNRFAYDVDTELGLLKFRDPRPFRMGGGGANAPDCYNWTLPVSNFTMRLRYRRLVASYQLGQFDVVPGSERVTLRGAPLLRDQDYTIDYISGYLELGEGVKRTLGTKDELIITFEYSPFGGGGQTTILGLRAEARLLENLRVGLTYVTNSGQNTREVPDVGYAPAGLNIYDTDFDFQLSPERFTRMLPPGLRPKDGKPLPVTFSLQGEMALSRLNLNTYSAKNTYEKNPEFGVAMLDDFQGAQSTRMLPLDRRSWFPSSKPLLGPPGTSVQYDGSPDRARNNRQYVSMSDPWSGVDPNYGWEYETSSVKLEQDKRRPLRMLYGGMLPSRWDGYRYVLAPYSQAGDDLTTFTHLDVRMKQDGSPLWLIFEFGEFSEDSNGNGVIDGEYPDPNGYRPATAADDMGVPMYYQWGAWGTDGFTAPFPQDSPNGELDTEDISRISFGRPREAPPLPASGANRYVGFMYQLQAGVVGWKTVRIPIDFRAAQDSGYPYLPYGVGISPQDPSWKRIVRGVRMWVTGVSGAPMPAGNAKVDIDQMQLSGSRWEARRLPADTSPPNIVSGPTDLNKFRMAILSEETDDRDPSQGKYQANTNWMVTNYGSGTVANTGLNRKREAGLVMQYRLNADDYTGVQPGGCAAIGSPLNCDQLGPYAAVKNYGLYGGQPLDLHDYRTLKFDVNAANVRNDDVLFVRLGSDEHNFYQYEVPVRQGGGWQTVAVPLDGAEGNRGVQRAIQTYTLTVTPTSGPGFATPTVVCQVGNASFFSLANVRMIAVGIRPQSGSSSAGAGAPPYELWVDNLRVSDPIVRWGSARRLASSLQIGSFVSLRTDILDRASTFREVEHQQRYEGVSLSQMSRRTANTTLNISRWTFLPITIQHQHSKDWLEDRRYLSATDINELRQALSTQAGFKGKRRDSLIGTTQFLPHPSLRVGLNQTFDESREDAVNEFSPSLGRSGYTFQPSLEWDAPQTIGKVPLGKQNRLSGKWTSRRTDFDFTPPEVHSACFNQPTATPSPGGSKSIGMDQEYRWTGRYEPAKNWNLSTNLLHGQKQGMHYLQEVSQFANFQTMPYAPPKKGRLGFPYTTIETTTQVRVDQSFDRWNSVKPRLNYDATNTRKRIATTLETRGTLDASLELFPMQWFRGTPTPAADGSFPAPSFGAGSGFSVRPSFRTDSTTTYYIAETIQYPNSPVLGNRNAVDESRILFGDRWGVYRWRNDSFFGRGRSNNRLVAIQGRWEEDPLKQRTPMANFDTYRETGELTMQIPVGKWDIVPRGTWEGRWSLTGGTGSFPTFDRTRTAALQAQTQKVPTFLPFLQKYLKPNLLTLSGGFTQVQGYDWRRQLWQEQRNFTWGPSLGFVPTDTISGSVSLGGAYGVEHRQVVTTETLNLKPGLQINHQFRTEKPIRLFNWFGFRGWTLRFSQALQMTYRLDADISRQKPKGSSGFLRPNRTDRYTATVGGRYQLMRSILWEANLSGELFHDRINPNQFSYREAAISTRLTAQF